MANESTTGGPLTATVGEQLAEKGHLGGVIEAEKAVAAGAERGAAVRVPWGAILAAAAGWVLAKSIARGLRRR